MLIKDINGEYYIVKKTDIRRVYKDNNGKTVILFNGQKNTPLRVKETVVDFFNIHYATK